MLDDLTGVIYAPATGVGRYALTVLRATGAGCDAVLRRLCGALPAPRRVSLRRLRGPDGRILDHAVVLWLPGPGSYTGEDSFELHLHGGTAVLSGVMSELGRLGARPAGPGDFSRRAFLNGRMDLLEAEAVADLVAAETEGQRDQALQQLGGALGTVYRQWASRLIRLVAQQEALIDFPDEHLPDDVEAGLLAEMAALEAEFTAHLQDDGRGERLRTGLVFAITGPPNVGKSSLMNALCRREVAIVSPVAGTTRDVIEARLDLAGISVTLLDTAGLRETKDPVEVEGVRRALDRAASADLVLHLAAPPYMSDESADDRGLRIGTMSDLGVPVPPGMLAVSVVDGSGVDDLVTCLAAIAKRMAGVGEAPVVTRARHRSAVVEAAGHLAMGQRVEQEELRGEELRLALRALGRITGAVGVEDILDSVFGQFCIGK